MRRITAVLSAIVLIGAMAGGSLGAAQPDVAGHHPAVGSWLVESDPDMDALSLRTLVVSADGTALAISSVAPNGSTGAGVWAPTGDTSAVLTFTLVTNGPAYVVLRASIDVAADGQSFTGTYTDEPIFDPTSPDGTGGEIGPGRLTGTRLTAQAPGTPAVSFAEFFPPDATPAASPVP
jgi:hypothetical protein